MQWRRCKKHTLFCCSYRSLTFFIGLSIQGDHLSGKPGKVRNFFNSGKSQGKQESQGKSQINHDCAILSVSITNSNVTSKSTHNAHICIEVFKIFPGVTPFAGGWTPTQIPTLSPLRGSTSALRTSAQSLQYLVRPFPTLLQKSGKSRGISFGLESGYNVYYKQMFKMCFKSVLIKIKKYLSTGMWQKF